MVSGSRPVVALIGCGPQAQRLHVPALEAYHDEHDVTIGVVVDLARCESQIREFFRGRRAAPRFLFLEPGWDDAQVRERLDAVCREAMVDRVMVSTEPMSHKKYITWALEHDYDVFCDKPLTAVDLSDRSVAGAARLIADFDEILAAEEKSAGTLSINTPLRRHAGHEYVREYLRTFIEEHGVPVTHFAVRHHQGCWYLPDEYVSRENHPYKYGFGKLLHSGYHHIDLLLSLLDTSSVLPEWHPDSLRVATQHARPADVLRQFPPARQFEMLGAAPAEQAGYGADAYGSCGETDVVASLAAVADGSVMATGSLELLNSSLSARSWVTPPAESGDAWDQVPHESAQIMIGPLLSVVVSEYKVAGGWPEDEHVSDFTVRCYRNAALVGGPAFEQPRLTDTTGLGNMRRSAYRQTLLAWLRGDAPAVPLRGQRNNVTLLATLYRSMLAQEAGLPGVAEMPLVTSQLQT